MRTQAVSAFDGLAICSDGLSQRLGTVGSRAGLCKKFNAADICDVVFGGDVMPQLEPMFAQLARRSLDGGERTTDSLGFFVIGPMPPAIYLDS
jgi:hypothetical protein